MYEGLVRNLRNAADKWEKGHPFIGVGELRVHDALRDAAMFLEEAEARLEQMERERDAAVVILNGVTEALNQAVDSMYADDSDTCMKVDYNTYLALRNKLNDIASRQY